MDKLFTCANQYVKESDWKELALIKICLCAIGMMIGMKIPEKKRKYVFGITAIVFFVTYIPLMVKFFRVMGEIRKTEE